MTEPAAFGPYRFTLTDAEARVAAARLALRSNLSRRFERDYVAPLVLFILLLVFIAILAFTGLIARRSAEFALMLGAILFLASRFLAHARLRRAQRLAKSALDGLAAGDEKTLIVGEGGIVSAAGAGEPRRVAFRDLAEAEDAGGLLCLWASDKDAAPILVPTRIFPDAGEAGRFLAFTRARIGEG